MGLEFGSDLACDSDSGPLMKVASKCQWGLQSSEDLTEAGESVSKMAHSHGDQQEASVPYYMGQCVGYFSVLTTWWQPSPRANNLKQCKTDSTMYFMTLPWKWHTITSVFHWYSVGRDYTRSWILGFGDEATLEAQWPTCTSASATGLSCWCLSQLHRQVGTPIIWLLSDFVTLKKDVNIIQLTFLRRWIWWPLMPPKYPRP